VETLLPQPAENTAAELCLLPAVPREARAAGPAENWAAMTAEIRSTVATGCSPAEVAATAEVLEAAARPATPVGPVSRTRDCRSESSLRAGRP